jgi:predicted phage terminase large subunit-like protein
MVDLSWFRRYSKLPPEDEWIEVVQFWDTASKGIELVNSPWVGMTVVHHENGYYIADVHRSWMEYPAGKRKVVAIADRWQRWLYCVVIEDRSTGQSLLQELPEESDHNYVSFDPDKDKITRFGVESPAIEAGKVWLPEKGPNAPPWLKPYEAEIGLMPAVDRMDQADVTSMMLRWFKDRGGEPRARWV